jgi:hypothetical protein
MIPLCFDEAKPVLDVVKSEIKPKKDRSAVVDDIGE